MERSSIELGTLNVLERQAILAQLDKILLSHHFKLSKRYPVLLRHLVETTLSGDVGSLKERSIGVDVFKRASDYSTADDPVVRITVAEVRKRLAQYYHQPEHHDELRIELTAGNYVPEFYLAIDPASTRFVADVTGPLEVTLADEPSPVPSLPVVTVPERQSTRLPIWIFALVGLLGIITMGFVVKWRLNQPAKRAVEAIWAPFFKPSHPLLVCIGKQGPQVDIPETTLSDHMGRVNAVTLDDVVTLLRVSKVLNAHDRNFEVKSSARTSFSDLRSGPTILIGALDNQWTLRYMHSLRYQIVWDSKRNTYLVADQEHPDQASWQVNLLSPYSQMTRDFAIVAFFRSAESDQQVLLIAGIGGDGTKAGAEYITEGDGLPDLVRQMAKGNKKNFEVVLTTEVINGASGPPRVLATQTW